jgi:mannose-6-phosphate isomerase-like protein (cupin superfamily)
MKDQVTYGLAMLLAAAGLVALTPTFTWAQSAERAIARDLAGLGLQWGPCPSFMPPGCQISVLHGDPAKHNADVFFRLPGNSKAERHWHNSAERMILVAGELLVEFDGQEAVVMRPGTYAYGPARLPHSATCRSAEACVLFIAFEEPVDAMEGAPR